MLRITPSALPESSASDYSLLHEAGLSCSGAARPPFVSSSCPIDIQLLKWRLRFGGRRAARFLKVSYHWTQSSPRQ
jgi:hypothetical protein